MNDFPTSPIETLFSSSKARLQCVKFCDKQSYNWIFLPGGPGLGSEYFIELIAQLHLPGKMWLLDLPGNGSYRPSLKQKPTLQLWRESLKEALSLLPNPILIAHSFGGLLFQSIDSSGITLKGLMLLDTAPKPFTQALEVQKLKKNLPDRKEDLKRFQKNPSDESFKHYCKQAACYWFTDESLPKGIQLIEKIPVSFAPFLWAQNFYSDYRRCWKPTSDLPVWLVAGSEDGLTPLWLYDDEGDFNQPHIKKVAIPGGAHFPWVEAPFETVRVFTAFSNEIAR